MNLPGKKGESGECPPPGRTLDFNIHGLIGIRLVDPSSSDAQIVEEHLGLAPAEFCGSPALTIRFVDRIDSDRPLRFLGREDVGFTDEHFIMLRSGNLARARAKFALEHIEERCEIICESGLPAIPLLRQLLNLLMLARGVVPVHAAAFSYRERGVMVAGWSHGSKTGTLLAFMDAGAKFVGDEWIYLAPGGDRMFGLPDQLEARPWYLDELPNYRRKVRFGDRVRTGLAAGLARAVKPLADRSERRNSLSNKIVRHLRQALLDQQSIHLKPMALFGSDACLLVSPLDTMILAVSHEAREIEVATSSAEQTAGRIAASFLHEESSLISLYRKHLFAFPDRRNPLLDRLEQIYREKASEALIAKQLYTMAHPYPVRIAALRTALEPLLG